MNNDDNSAKLKDKFSHVTAKICKTLDIGVNHNLFGGRMLEWLDEAGAIFARSVTGEEYMVTVKMSEVVFHKPVKERDIVHLWGELVRIGETSVTLIIEARVRRKVVCSTEMVFVCTTPLGQKKKIGGREPLINN